MPVIFLIVCVLMRLWRCRVTLVMINLRKGGEFQVVALNEIDDLLSLRRRVNVFINSPKCIEC